VVADGLAALINDQKDMVVVGQAGSVGRSDLTSHRAQPGRRSDGLQAD